MDFDSLYKVNELSIQMVVINLFVGFLLSFILMKHFEQFGSTISSKKELARTFPFLILVVCLIISVIKSSIALSLGLVGALSIVRFRTPIKEPEELVYLFMAIAIGLGLGANQMLLTVVSTLFILVAIAIFRRSYSKGGSKSIFISLEWEEKGDAKVKTKKITDIICSKTAECDLKRFDLGRPKTPF